VTIFEMVKYHGQTYPREIPLRVEEVAGHFDIERINHSLRYSLHTEYSYGKRKFESGGDFYFTLHNSGRMNMKTSFRSGIRSLKTPD
jgi:hypothetical protein